MAHDLSHTHTLATEIKCIEKQLHIKMLPQKYHKYMNKRTGKLVQETREEISDYF